MAIGGDYTIQDTKNRTFNVRDFGAAGTGQQLDTEAIQKALDACAQAGGGVVRFPPGTYCAGTLHLRSHVNLHVEEGAVLQQSKAMEHYDTVRPDCYARHLSSSCVFLHGYEIEHVAIEGKGAIDGNKGDLVTGRDPRGPVTICFEKSNYLRVQDVTVRQSPSEPAVFFGCRHVEFFRVTDLNGFSGGITFACCQDVLCDGYTSDGSGDDPLCLKNDSTNYSYETRPPCGYLTENIVIRNTMIRNTLHGHPAFKLGTGTYGVFRNIVVENCTFENTGAMFTIQLMRSTYKQTPERVIEKIRLANITVRDVGRIFDITSFDVTRPVIRDITVENIIVEGDCRPSVIYGRAEALIQNFVVRDLTVNNSEVGPFWLRVRHVEGLTLRNMRLDQAETVVVSEHCRDLKLDHFVLGRAMGDGPLVRIIQSAGVLIRDFSVPEARQFLHVEGEKSEGIRLVENDLDKVAVPFDAADEVTGDAVEPRADRLEYSDMAVPKDVAPNEGFCVDVTVQNRGAAGATKTVAAVDGEAAGSTWVWLKPGERRRLTITTRPFYKPGTYTMAVSGLEAKGSIKPAPAKLIYGERLSIRSPAAAFELTRVRVPIENIGGKKGRKMVELLADGKVAASKQVELGPGEKCEVVLEHRLAETGPRVLKVGDFPPWPYATFANTEADFYLTRKHIIIEAKGSRHRITDERRQYAAAYIPKVKGNFDARVRILYQDITGPSDAGGLIVKNNIDKPGESGGAVVRRYLKYAAATNEDPVDLAIRKHGEHIGEHIGGDIHSLGKDHATAQDVGIFVHACNERDERHQVVFSDFTVE